MNKQDENKFEDLLTKFGDASYNCGKNSALVLEEYSPFYMKYSKTRANLLNFVKEFDRIAPVEAPKIDSSFIEQLLKAMNDLGEADGIGYKLIAKESPKPAKETEASPHENDEKLCDELKKKALSLSNKDFLELIGILGLKRCLDCGTMQKGRACQCNNDE
jgi:hypothetical protein